MKHEINFNCEDGQNYDLFINAVYKGVEFVTYGTVSGYVPKYYVYVKSDFGECETIYFPYSGSINDGNAGKSSMDKKDLEFALYCFVSDAIAGESDFKDFCSEFGYDSDSRKAEKIHKACMKSTDKAKRIFHDLYQVANAVNEFA